MSRSQPVEMVDTSTVPRCCSVLFVVESANPCRKIATRRLRPSDHRCCRSVDTPPADRAVALERRSRDRSRTSPPLEVGWLSSA